MDGDPRADATEVMARWRRVERRTAHDPGSGLRLPEVTDATRADADVLAAAGHPHDAVHRYTHDSALAALRDAGRTWDLPGAAAAWTAGLWSAPWTWRSALTGHLLATTLPGHAYDPYPSGSPCRVCGAAAEGALAATAEHVLRLGGGAPIDGAVPEHALALAGLADLPRPEPTEHDRWTLRAVLTVLRALPPGTRYAAARTALTRARLLDTSAPHAYGAVLEELALVGAVAPTAHPGLAVRWSDYAERDRRPSVRVEVQAPLAWWSSSDGLREDVLEHVFTGFATGDVDLDGPRPTPEPARGATVVGALPARLRALDRTGRTAAVPRSVGDGPPAVGDVWAVRVTGDRWVTCRVAATDVAGGRPYAQVEMLAGVHDAFPVAPDMDLRAQPRRDGRWHAWVHSLDRTPHVRRVAQGTAAPASPLPPATGAERHPAKALAHLAGWCYPELD
ncbi:hypothetical protein [Cellulomonas oligotrophica]|uniref:Uncharacterized protein n=1 Tax=Cellulomonas oligotrophica TaxID=931536 RepID=A0A7Y9JZL3_9CELL|nr:hypothetical protein [Cellulomonas oligotrophica]NYD86929.1 hypothetical protein [Cellulomonas oligotrophica]GIG32285.1 hypothetical protein Col01nite_14440 [Cellulomonas oligotrophica]